MTAKTLMIQGTGSSVGKSVMVAALCRIFKQDGLSVAPFKSQNMALNSFVTREGGEMGRAQVVQAQAAGIEPIVDMNPIMLKPEADARCQVVVMGHPALTCPAREYYLHTPRLLLIASEALERLRSSYDLVIIEGAGSPAEINLRHHEIVNMRVAKLAQAPVLLVGDIDKGGVFASLVGTLALLDEEEAALIKGFIINKFRGDISILKPGLDYLEQRTGRPVLGVVPYYHDIIIGEEDSIYRPEASASSAGPREAPGGKVVDIAVIHFPRISNSTDFEPLQQEPGVRLRYITAPYEMGSPDAIILPGTKSTIADLAALHRSGLAQTVVERARAGTPVVGICGGYQMLGRRISDPAHVESDEESVAGLGLLDVDTVFQAEKATSQVEAEVVCNRGLLQGLKGQRLTGYEIHMGQSFPGKEQAAADASAPFRIVRCPEPVEGSTPSGAARYSDGAINEAGYILGTYLHGLFDNTSFRRAFLAALHRRRALPEAEAGALSFNGRTPPSREEQFDRLAELVRRSLKMDLVYKICRLRGWG